MEDSYQSKPSKSFRNNEKKEATERKKTLMLLIRSYLLENHMGNTVDSLNCEAQLSNDYEVCDNIDLSIILQEFQSYYFIKFNKNPKMIKLSDNPGGSKETKNRSGVHCKSGGKGRTAPNCEAKNRNSCQPNEEVQESFSLEVRSLSSKNEHGAPKSYSSNDSGVDVAEGLPQLSKPLLDFVGYTNEWRDLADLILKEAVPKTLGVTWKDCVGLEKPIELLKEAVVYPLMYPNMFTGLLEPWKAILLYGPPGTGKTLLAKALACENQSLFINVTSSSFVNKWRGESEKMIKVLFDVAKYYSPSTIFIDEIDALTSRYGDCNHEATRRFKSELLTQLDGITKHEGHVFVLASTNRPWDLDAAMLRRFEKRILIGLPSADARGQIFKYHLDLQNYRYNQGDYKAMAEASSGLSGSEIKLACKEACMAKLREALLGEKGRLAKKMNIKQPCADDVVCAIKNVNPVSDVEISQKYLNWEIRFGCL